MFARAKGTAIGNAILLRNASDKRNTARFPC
jgi:hypothetical protein